MVYCPPQHTPRTMKPQPHVALSDPQTPCDFRRCYPSGILHKQYEPVLERQFCKRPFQNRSRFSVLNATLRVWDRGGKDERSPVTRGCKQVEGSFLPLPILQLSIGYIRCDAREPGYKCAGLPEFMHIAQGSHMGFLDDVLSIHIVFYNPSNETANSAVVAIRKNPVQIGLPRLNSQNDLFFRNSATR
jgi:hypothetical protein